MTIVLKQGALLGVLFVVSYQAASAQDFERIAPKELPAAPPATIAPPAREEPAADTRPLIPALKGLVFVSRPQDVVAAGVEVTGIDASRVPILAAAGVPEEVRAALGRPLSLADLQGITRAIVLRLRAVDRPLVDVVVPEQDITAGTVQIVVSEFRVGTVTAEGNEWFESADLVGALRIAPGDTVDSQTLLDDVDFLNTNPFRQVDLVYRPGARVGETDLVLRTTDRLPFRLYGGWDNTGPETSGRERVFAGFNWGDAFGLGHLLSYQVSTSTDAFGDRPVRAGGRDAPTFLAQAATYDIPLPWHDRIILSGGYAEVLPLVPTQFGQVGRSAEANLRYQVPLRGAPGLSHAVAATYQFKSTNNDLEFGGTAISRSSTQIHQLELNYQLNAVDDLGATGATLSLYLSPGGITPENTDRAFRPDATRIGRFEANARYAYALAGIDRVTRLPWDLSWGVRFRAQVSSANLLPSEQLGYGGFASVRGYDERAVNTDQGILLSNELRSPARPLLGWLGLEDPEDRLQLLAFVDYGGGGDSNPAPGQEPWQNLASTGLGFRYSLASNLDIRFDYGWQLVELAGDAATGRAHFSLTLSY